MASVRVRATPSPSKLEVAFSGASFDPESESWVLSKDSTVRLSWARKALSDALRASLVRVLTYYAKNYSPSHTVNMNERFKALVVAMGGKTRIVRKISPADLINYRAALTRKDEWYLSSMKGFLLHWVENRFHGVDPNVESLLRGWRLKGNQSGVAVKTMCPLKGPLVDLEFDALHAELTNAFARGDIDAKDATIVHLLLMTGRRPCQIADLKLKDVVVSVAKDGLRQVDIHVPRRKQRSSIWRSSFKRITLSPDVADLVLHVMKITQHEALAVLGPACLPVVDELPLFLCEQSLECLAGKSEKKIQKAVRSQSLHSTSSSLSSKTTAICKALRIHSVRTGKYLKIFPTRLRRTLATRAARSGVGTVVIGEMLDHSTDESAKIYTANVPEHVDALNEAMARQLAPYAQAFCGVLVKKETGRDAAEKYSGLVRTSSGTATGNCGQFGFCGALSPIACYTCIHFRPWLEGPHKEVLASLIDERQRLMERTSDISMAAINDRTILAVAEVVQRCEQKSKLSESCT